MKIIITIMACFFLLTGCKPSSSNIESIAKKEVSLEMKDPESTKFSNIESKELGGGANDKTGYCVFGEVNGKNSFGAYSGSKPFGMTIVAESVLFPFIEPNYQVGGMVVVSDAADSIRYLALRELCK